MNSRIATAEWTDPVQFASAHRFKTGDFWLGRSITDDAAPLGYADDRHICLVAGNRGGKGTTSIINNLCLWPGSAIVVDPKGENASITSNRRGGGSGFCEGMGQSVHVLDPFGATLLAEELKGSFNPLDTLDPKDPRSITKASTIADALVPVLNQHDPSWENRARSMVHALILHVLTAAEYEGERNLLTVRKLIMRGDWKAREALIESGDENPPPSQHLLWNSVRLNTAFDVLAGMGERFVQTAIHAPEQFEGLIDPAIEATRFLDDPHMQKCLETSSFKLSELKTSLKGATVYLCLPQMHMNTHSGWLRMMIALSIYEMQVIKGQPACGHRVLFCLDEFAGLKKMDIIEDNIPLIASFGVKLFVVLQSLEQLKGTYEKKWETFLANCGLKIFFSVEDHFSREYVSKFIGDTELIKETNSFSETEGTNESRTEGESFGTSRTISSSQTISESLSTTISDSVSKAKNWGVNRNAGWSYGSSEGNSWNPHPLILRNTDRFFSLFRKHETENIGQNTSRSGGSGKSSGSSISKTRGASNTTGKSASLTEGVSTTDNYTANRSFTTGRSHSTTQGTNESVHKRPLVTPDEIGRYFKYITNADDPRYPGFALVLLSGESPLVVRKVNYYEDPEFTALFDQHPDHAATAPEKLLIERCLLAPDRQVFEMLRLNDYHPQILEWFAKPGCQLASGDPLFAVYKIKGAGILKVEPSDFGENAEASKRWQELAQKVQSGVCLPIKSPIKGVLSTIEISEGPITEGQVLARVIVNRRLEYLESQHSNRRLGDYEVIGFSEHAANVIEHEANVLVAEKEVLAEAAKQRLSEQNYLAEKLAYQKNLAKQQARIEFVKVPEIFRKALFYCGGLLVICFVAGFLTSFFSKKIGGILGFVAFLLIPITIAVGASGEYWQQAKVRKWMKDEEKKWD